MSSSPLATRHFTLHHSSSLPILQFFNSPIVQFAKPSVKMTTIKVGAVQAEPVWFDLQGSVEKTISYIKKAGADGVNVLGFPEVFIPGYPW